MLLWALPDISVHVTKGTRPHLFALVTKHSDLTPLCTPNKLRFTYSAKNNHSAVWNEKFIFQNFLWFITCVTGFLHIQKLNDFTVYC